MTETPWEPMKTVLVGEALRVRRPCALVDLERAEVSHACLSERVRIDAALEAARVSDRARLALAGVATGVRVNYEVTATGQTLGRLFEARVRGRSFPPAFHQPGAILCGSFCAEGGVFTFETRALGGVGQRVLLAWPQEIHRSSRRHLPRCTLPPGAGVRVCLPLTDGEHYAGHVRDLSRDGMRIAVPAHVNFPLGRPARIGLMLRSDHGLPLVAVASNLACDDRTGELLYGLQFVGHSDRVQVALERFIARVARGETEPASRRDVEAEGQGAPNSAPGRRDYEVRG